MPVTSPDSIDYPDTSYTGGIVAAMAAQATSVQAALDSRASKSFVWADATERAAETGMAAGDTGFQQDTAVEYKYTTVWVEWSSDWISWGTTPTNLTVGTGGTTLQQYRWIAGRLLFRYKYVLGSSGFAMGTNPTINLPFPIRQAVTRFPQLVGSGTAFDASTTTVSYTGFSRLNGTTDDEVVLATYAGTYTAITASAPWTWAASDEIGGEFWADPA